MAKKSQFIILTNARSGSTFLLSLLMSSPYVLMRGELFNLSVFPKETIDQVVLDPQKYIQDTLYSDDSKIQSCGFKLFHKHPFYENFLCSNKKVPFKDELHPNGIKKMDHKKRCLIGTYPKKVLKRTSKRLTTYLRTNTDFKIIHLERKNKLKRLLSQKKAAITDVWSSEKMTDDVKELKVPLSYKECLKDFKNTEKARNRALKLFKRHEKIHVFYEDLAKNTENVMYSIQEFIGAKPVSLKSELKKQQKLPLSEAIGNYAELKNKFKGKPESVYFED